MSIIRLVLDWLTAQHAVLTCDPLTWGAVSGAYWDQLMGAGWAGSPTDGLEAIYPLRCQGLDE